MPAPILIEAEYAHTLLGRRVRINVAGGRAQIPVLVEAVRYVPERHMVLIDGDTPVGMIAGIGCAPDDVLQVEPLPGEALTW